MNTFFQQLKQQFMDVWAKLTRMERILLVTIPSVIFIAILIFVLFSLNPTYKVLYSRLSMSDASNIVAELKKENVPYQLANNGSTILVPASQVYNTRLTLAGMGLPRGGGVGFEIFDHTQFGMTDFTEKVDYLRALQGELERTINSLKEVRSSRVHIVIPHHQLFTENEKPATAAVVIDLKNGYQLTREEVRGVVHLVAASVEGLKPENVTVLDDKGNILSNFIREELALNGKGSSDMLGGGDSILTRQAIVSLRQMEVQQQYEDMLQNKINRMLDRVLGNKRFVVSVSAQLNFSKKETDSETYRPVVDGMGIPRSQEVEKEQYLGNGPYPNNFVGGVPGTQSNIPGYQAALTGQNSQYSKEKTITNYEINRTVRHEVSAPGTPKVISVGIFVDDLQPQQVPAIKAAVIAAAGLDLNRGDQVDVENMPFDNTRSLMAMKEQEMATQQAFYFTLGKIALLFLVGVGLLLFLRSLLKTKKTKEYMPIPEDLGEPEAPMPMVEDLLTPEMTADDLARMEAAREAKRRESLRKEVFNMAEKNPENIAQIIKKWLSEE